MLKQIQIYLEMIKFSHTIFALPFALLALALAVHRAEGVHLLDVVGVLACMVFARSAAMGFNRWADRDVDAQNPRTSGRAIPAGQLSARKVLAFVVACSAAFVASTGLFILSRGNWLPMAFSLPLLAFLFGYSYAKRFTSLAHVWLGVALAGSPVGVWIALLPPGDWFPPLLLAVAIVAWVTGFDVIYACQDLEVDRKLRLRSIPARFGFEGAMNIARVVHVVMIAALIALGLATPELGRWYWAALGGVSILLVVEHWLVRGRDLMKINIAFFQVNGVISMGLLVATLLDLWWKSAG